MRQHLQQAQAAEVEQQRLKEELARVHEDLRQLKQQWQEKQRLWQQQMEELRQQQEEQGKKERQEQGAKQQQEQLQPPTKTAAQSVQGQQEQMVQQIKQQQQDRESLAPRVSEGHQQEQQQQLKDLGRSSRIGSTGPMPAADVEAAVIQSMEGQLVRLSGIIRSHELELQQLRAALATACADRHQLQLVNAQLLAATKREKGEVAGNAKEVAAERDGVKMAGVKPDSMKKGVSPSSKGGGIKQSKSKARC